MNHSRLKAILYTEEMQPSLSKNVLFIHGLSTYNSDHLKIGPLDFGPMDQHIQNRLKDQCRYFALHQFGAPTLDQQITNCTRLARKLVEAENISDLSIVGHSTGGLIARALAYGLEGQVKKIKVLTFGCPHYGIEELQKKLENLTQLSYGKALKYLGYNISERLSQLAELDSENVKNFNRMYPPLVDKSYLSISCALPHRQLPFLMRKLRNLSGLSRENSDGIVDEKSQLYGDHSARLKLTHLSQLGFFIPGAYHPSEKPEFEKLIRLIEEWI